MSKVGSSLYSRLHGIFKESSIATVKPTKPRKQTKSSKFPSKLKESSASSASVGDGSNSSNDAKESKATKLIRKVENFKKSCESESFRQIHGLYSAFIRRLREAKKFSTIDEVLQYQKKFEDIKSEDFVIRMMLLYGYSGMAEHAHKLFDEMPELNCERTIKSFNALLSAYVNSRKLDEAMKAFKELPEKLGIIPDLVTYNTMIKALCRKGSMDDILSIFEELEKNGLEPDLITFNTLLEEFYRRDLFVEGDRIWDLMKSKDLAPNIRSYNSRVRGLTRNKKITDAVNLMDAMKTEGISPDVHTYNAFITAYRTDNNLEEAVKWYNEMKENGLTPDTVTYCLLIPLFCKKGDLDKAVEISEEAIKHKVLSRPNMYKPVVERLMGEGKIDEARQLVKNGKLQSYFRYLPNLSSELCDESEQKLPALSSKSDIVSTYFTLWISSETTTQLNASPYIILEVIERYGEQGKVSNLRFDGEVMASRSGGYYGQSGYYLPSSTAGNYPYPYSYPPPPPYVYAGNCAYPMTNPPHQTEVPRRMNNPHTAPPHYTLPTPPPRPLHSFSYIEPPYWPTSSSASNGCVIM